MNDLHDSGSKWQRSNWWDFLIYECPGPLAVIGAGGKTALLARIAAEADLRSKSVILTSSTMMAEKQKNIAKSYIHINDDELIQVCEGSVLITGEIVPELSKLRGLESDVIDKIRERYPDRPLIIEADGARGRALKFPGKEEPVIPGCVQTVVAVTGFDALISDLTPSMVHRWELYQRLRSGATRLDPGLMADILADERGSFHRCVSGVRRVWLVNAADDVEKCRIAENFIDQVMLKAPGVVDSVACGSLINSSEMAWRK